MASSIQGEKMLRRVPVCRFDRYHCVPVHRHAFRTFRCNLYYCILYRILEFVIILKAEFPTQVHVNAFLFKIFRRCLNKMSKQLKFHRYMIDVLEMFNQFESIPPQFLFHLHEGAGHFIAPKIFHINEHLSVRHISQRNATW